MADGVIVFNAAGTIIYVNPMYEKMSRLTRRELIGQNGIDIAKKIINPADFDTVISGFKAAMAGKPIPAISILFTFEDGSSLPIIYSTSFIKDPSGVISSIISIVKDISDIRRVEEALRESEEQFRSLADAMTQLVWIADAEGNSIYYNRRAIDYMNMKASTQAERLACVHPADRIGMREKWSTAIASGVDVLEEVYRLRRHDGVYRWFIGRTILIRDAQKRFVRLYGTATDIDDLKKAEEALAESLEILAQAERIGKIGSWMQKIPGNDIYLSDGVRGILGIPESDELSFDKVLLFIHPDDMPVLQPKIRAIFENGTPFSETYRLKFPDGSIKHILGNAEATFDPQGRPVLIHGSLQDITELKQAEEKIMSLLSEKELILREVHHRIKNNMNTMISLLSLQANMTKDLAAVGALKDASNRMKSMGVLYDKLYRQESMQELSIKTYLPALIDEIIANFPNRGIVRVVKQINDFVLGVNVLSTIGIIVNELITNAMKYAFKGRNDGVITVTAAVRDNHVTISLADNGIGIPDSVDIATSAGFGLQLVGLLARQLHGTIRIEREGGAKFVLEFAV